MTCARVLNHVLAAPSPPVFEALTGAGSGTDVPGTTVPLGDANHQAALIWLQVTGEAADPSNLPFTFEVYGEYDDGGATQTAEPLETKDLTGITDWEGALFLEINCQHIGAAELKYGFPITGLIVQFQGENLIDYSVIVTLFDPEYLDPSNIGEVLT